jgi:hypothetical protein
MRSFARRHAGALVLSSLVIFTTLLVVLHVREYTAVSPIDELQHIDATVKWSQGEPVRRGDRVGQSAMREEACRGIDNFNPPPCGSALYHSRDFQEGGYNTAYIHPPVYYALTGTGARLIGISGDHSFVTEARLMGIVWLDGAVVLIWLLLAEFCVSYAARCVLILLTLTTQVVLHMSSIVNPDAAALAAGAAILLAVVRWERGAMHWLVPGAMAAIAVLLKSSFATAAGVCVLYVLIRLVQRRHDARQGPTRTEYLRVLIGISAGLIVASGAWVIAQNALAHVPATQTPQVKRFKVDSFPFRELRGQLFAGVTPIQLPAYVPTFFDNDAIKEANDVVDVLFLVATIAALVLSQARCRMRAIAGAALTTMLLVGPVFVFFNYVVQGTFVDIPPRYGLPVVPAVLVSSSSLLRWKAVLVLAGVLAALIGLETLVALTRG